MSERLKDCRLCGRCGYRGFASSGDYGWVCTNERACEKRRTAASSGRAADTGGQQE